mmetsp:Transcript_22419/g.56649  ORF Transcript_22419/g.56649 Transcript_22419/m.56649 type:complete len:242 (+) Transcript_22419:1568-2293(+)
MRAVDALRRHLRLLVALRRGCSQASLSSLTRGSVRSKCSARCGSRPAPELAAGYAAGFPRGPSCWVTWCARSPLRERFSAAYRARAPPQSCSSPSRAGRNSDTASTATEARSHAPKTPTDPRGQNSWGGARSRCRYRSKTRGLRAQCHSCPTGAAAGGRAGTARQGTASAARASRRLGQTKSCRAVPVVVPAAARGAGPTSQRPAPRSPMAAATPRPPAAQLQRQPEQERDTRQERARTWT